VEIVYLNLAARPERNEQFLRLNAGLADFRRIDAIFGADQRADELIRAGVIVEPRTSFTHGALGNALSHKRVWEQCAAGDHVVTLAEDDGAINRQFPQKAPEVLAKLPPDWDIVLWGWNFDSVLHVGIMGGCGLPGRGLRRPAAAAGERVRHRLVLGDAGRGAAAARGLLPAAE
jgi:glycosyl transferase family 25